MKFLPDIYAHSSAEIERIQGEILSETVARAASASPFYRERFARERVDPSRIRSISDLSVLPFTKKEEIQQGNRDFLAVAPDCVAEIVATTGTTGRPVYLPMTAGDIDRLAENERRGFSWMGAAPGDRFHIAVTLDNLFIAGLAYHRGLQKLGASAIRVGSQPARRHLDLMRELRPEGLVAVPSLLLALARQAAQDGEDLRSFAPRRAMLIGDAIRAQDLGPNTLGRLVTEAWGGDTFSTYGLTEAEAAFHECPARRGLHSHPDLVAIEIMDESGQTVPEGEPGELVITTLQVEGMPLLRYRTGDVTFRVPGVCPCGRNGPRIGPVLGRMQQRLKVKGTTLYPRTIEDALLGVGGVENFVIEAHSNNDGTDKVVVRVGSSRRDACFREILNDNLFSKARVTPDVHVTSPAEIDKISYEGGRRKPRTFIDRRKTGGAGKPGER